MYGFIKTKKQKSLNYNKYKGSVISSCAQGAITSLHPDIANTCLLTPSEARFCILHFEVKYSYLLAMVASYYGS